MKRTFKTILAGMLVGSVLFGMSEYSRYRNQRDNMTSDQRQEQIINTFSSLEGVTPIRTVSDGFEAINRNPQEVGYYLRTAELLEKEKDYERARSVLEQGLDNFEEPPITICDKLQEYTGNVYDGCPEIVRLN